SDLGLCPSSEAFPTLQHLVCAADTAAEESSTEPVSIPGHRAHTLREDFYGLLRSSNPVVGRDRIVVSTLRCGRSNPGSNPGHGMVWTRPERLALDRETWLCRDGPRHVGSSLLLRLRINERMQISKHCSGLVSGNTTTVRLGHPFPAGPVAQWITRLTTDQKILGSTAGSAAVRFDRTLARCARSALSLWV